MNYYTGIGSRSTPEPILSIMTEIAQQLRLCGYTLRSGAAAGADAAFEAGAGDQKDIYLPWPRFNRHPSTLTFTDEAMTMAAQYHPAWDRLSSGAKKMMARNCHQVLGADLNTPSRFVICWTPGAKLIGGTAQAIRIAKDHSITVINLGHEPSLATMRKKLADART